MPSPQAGPPGAPSVHIVRGELLDDWHARLPAPGGQGKPAPARKKAPTPGRVRPEAVEALRELGRLRARSFAAEQATAAHGLDPPRRRIELVFDPGPLERDAAPEHHVLEIGKATPQGCFARLDAEPVVFELEHESCAAALGAWVE